MTWAKEKEGRKLWWIWQTTGLWLSAVYLPVSSVCYTLHPDSCRNNNELAGGKPLTVPGGWVGGRGKGETLRWGCCAWHRDTHFVLGNQGEQELWTVMQRGSVCLERHGDACAACLQANRTEALASLKEPSCFRHVNWISAINQVFLGNFPFMMIWSAERFVFFFLELQV